MKEETFPIEQTTWPFPLLLLFLFATGNTLRIGEGTTFSQHFFLLQLSIFPYILYCNLFSYIFTMLLFSLRNLS